ADGQRAGSQPRPQPPGRSLMSVATPPAQSPVQRPERQAVSLFRPDIVKRALFDSLIKLDPRVQIRNPVMFVVEIGALITTVSCLIQAFGGKPLGHSLTGIPHAGAPPIAGGE